MIGDWPIDAVDSADSPPAAIAGRVAAAVIVVMVLLVLSVVASLQAPRTQTIDAPVSTVSGKRALEQLRWIAAEPHAVTGLGHARVRDLLVDRLLDLGWDAHIQAGTADASPTVYNVVARLAGTDSTGAVMVAGHYDSVHAGPGAADDGLAAASMVEVARALAQGPPLRNDVILNFTDGEEACLCGARIFVREHPWRDDVGMVLNFEGGGPRGPLVMIETSKADVDLVKTYASVAPSPVSTSLMPTVIEAAKEGGIGSSDFVPFRELDEPGMNFSNGIDTGYRHTPGDEVDRIDVDTLQHQAGTMHALVLEYGERDLVAVGSDERDVIWVGLFSFVMPIWSNLGSTVLMLLSVGAFAAAVVGARRRSLGRPRGILRGAGTTLLAIPASVFVVTIIVGVIQWIRPSFKPHFAGFTPREQLPGAGLPGSELLWWAMVMIATATTVLLLARARRRWGAVDTALGATFVFVLLTVLTTLTLPGLSYLFAPAAVFSAASLAAWLWWLDGSLLDWRAGVVLTGGAVPTLLIGTGFAHQFQLVTVANAAVIAPFIALFAAQLVPSFELLGAADRRLPSGGVVGVAGILLALGLLVVRADPITARDHYEGPFATEITDTHEVAELRATDWQVDAVVLNGTQTCLRAGTERAEAHWCPTPSTARLELDVQQVRGTGGTMVFGGVADPTVTVRLTVDGRVIEVDPIEVDGIDGAVFSVELAPTDERVDDVVAIAPDGSVVARWTGFDVRRAAQVYDRGDAHAGLDRTARRSS